MLTPCAEGTRIRDPELLGEPRNGAGRLALQTGATLVAAAISGSGRLFFGPRALPRRMRIAFGEPIEVLAVLPTREPARELVADELWPLVEREFGRLRAPRRRRRRRAGRR